jgi:hypothetical protein
MKLYTEEQVKKVYNEGFSDGFEIGERKIERTINSLVPIELPSDEEIDNHFDIDINGKAISYGAKWMKEQILNQNK